MGDEYAGIDLAVFYNTVDISGKGRSARINENAGEPEEVDITHKGDTARQRLETFPGAPGTQVDFSCLDETADAAAIMDFAINAKDTLFIYPKGRVHTYPQLTLQNARLIQRQQPIEYDQEVTIDAQFSAKNSLTRGTYSSA